MRDRLIELLKEAHESWLRYVDDCAFNQMALSFTFEQMFADHLLANGVIVLPCKVDDTVYTNLSMQGWYYRTKDRPYKARIVFIGVNSSEKMGCGYINVLFEKGHNMMQFELSEIGKSVFLTREEAERALRKEDEGK